MENKKENEYPRGSLGENNNKKNGGVTYRLEGKTPSRREPANSSRRTVYQKKIWTER